MNTNKTTTKKTKDKNVVLCRIPFVRMSTRLKKRIISVSVERGISYGAAFLEIVKPSIDKECD